MGTIQMYNNEYVSEKIKFRFPRHLNHFALKYDLVHRKIKIILHRLKVPDKSANKVNTSTDDDYAETTVSAEEFENSGDSSSADSSPTCDRYELPNLNASPIPAEESKRPAENAREPCGCSGSDPDNHGDNENIEKSHGDEELPELDNYDENTQLVLCYLLLGEYTLCVQHLNELSGNWAENLLVPVCEVVMHFNHDELVSWCRTAKHLNNGIFAANVILIILLHALRVGAGFNVPQLVFLFIDMRVPINNKKMLLLDSQLTRLEIVLLILKNCLERSNLKSAVNFILDEELLLDVLRSSRKKENKAEVHKVLERTFVLLNAKGLDQLAYKLSTKLMHLKIDSINEGQVCSRLLKDDLNKWAELTLKTLMKCKNSKLSDFINRCTEYGVIISEQLLRNSVLFYWDIGNEGRALALVRHCSSKTYINIDKSLTEDASGILFWSFKPEWTWVEMYLVVRLLLDELARRRSLYKLGDFIKISTARDVTHGKEDISISATELFKDALSTPNEKVHKALGHFDPRLRIMKTEKTLIKVSSQSVRTYLRSAARQ